MKVFTMSKIDLVIHTG
jgi:hypothetical protein